MFHSVVLYKTYLNLDSQARTLPRVSTEMSLHVLAYNMKRAMNILGTRPLMAAIRAWGAYKLKTCRTLSAVMRFSTN
ncbi:MAG TPA: hypothetical protein DDW55_12925 [Gammaproteobacteria bacterium]|nr:hypothetical protein [Gammaproteobacteria bacterium]